MFPTTQNESNQSSLSARSVVCVGGDGMFSEIVHGLVSHTQKDEGVDENFMKDTLIPCKLRIGIIPAGWSTVTNL